MRSISVVVGVWFLFTAAGAAPTASSSIPDERHLEGARDSAIFQALDQVDPRTAEKRQAEARAKAEEPNLPILVQRLQHERKQEFRYLPWSHIKKMINRESVLAKQQFIQERNKNLDNVIRRAMNVHIPGQVALERITLAKFRITKAVRDLIAEATLTADLKGGTLTRQGYTSESWRMAFRQPIFRGGVLWNTMFLEWSNMEIAKREYDKTVADLINDVSQAYFEYERAQNLLRDRQQLFGRAEEQKKISDQKYDAKIISEIEKLNTDSLYSQAQYDLETSQQEVEVAKLDLQKFLSLQPNDPIELDPLYDVESLNVDDLKKELQVNTPEGPKPFDQNLEGLIDMAYEHRPDLQVEASKLKATQYAYRVALGKRLPQADFIIEFGELGEAFSDPAIGGEADPKHRKEFKVGAEVTWNLGGNTFKYTYDHDQRAPSVTQFQAGAGTRSVGHSFSLGILDDLGQFSSMIEAKISALEQVVELEKTEREVIREVKEAFYNFTKSMIQVESTYKRMRYREKLSQLAKHRLGTTEVQISEYLQAELDFSEERSQVYKAISEFFQARSQLNRAIGVQEYIPVQVLE